MGGVLWRRVDCARPRADFSRSTSAAAYGHTHKKQDEVYVVLRGSGRMKLDDEIVELKEWDAVRVPPGTWRGYEAGPEGLELLVIGAPNGTNSGSSASQRQESAREARRRGGRKKPRKARPPAPLTSSSYRWGTGPTLITEDL